MCIRDRRVPVPTGSTTILTAVVKKAGVTKEDINAAMKAASSESFGYNEDAIVSSDVIGMRFGSLFDATQTMVAQIADDLYEVQVVSWYDNENSYTSQMVRTITVSYTHLLSLHVRTGLPVWLWQRQQAPGSGLNSLPWKQLPGLPR